VAYIIAIAGKGGTGKTTLSALMTRIISKGKFGSLLAIDADPNSNLGEMLGLRPEETIGGILDDIASHPDKIPSGMPKDRFIQYQVQAAIKEGDGFDLLTMGRPEGPGCYCYVNNVLRNTMARLEKDYDYIIIDNEAGLEHLSRRMSRQASVLLVVSDATAQGLRAARRIGVLAKELNIKTQKNILLANCCDQDLGKSRLDGLGFEYIGNIPEDKEVARLSLGGSSLKDLNEDAASIKALARLGDKIWPKN